MIKAVREGPTPLPSTILYRFANKIVYKWFWLTFCQLFVYFSRVTNPYSNLQCATLSSDATMLITGCENASLISWDLLPRQPTLHNGYTNSEVTLSKNYFRIFKIFRKNIDFSLNRATTQSQSVFGWLHDYL